ncbi:hypothetical protein FHX82_005067 [Amycolatopsis bartoniae]|nr:hypothetical protein [Amycolatopsis bartoniae]
MLEAQGFGYEDGDLDVRCIGSGGYHNLGDYDGI